ncbi:MAG: Hsp20/alpha crystallin family protein [Actinobacteria bacterium]|nr:Hsp20/alpha crystallin family protein [Actinomycetota bacterium]
MASRLVRWDPFREISALQQELNRALGGTREGEGSSQGWVPAVDAWETDKEIVYALDLPGIPQDTISIELDDNSLTISGERERSSEMTQDAMYRFERRFGQFSRTIGLPPGVSDADVSADYRDGVLELRVSKPQAPQPRRIQISGSQAQTIEGEATQQQQQQQQQQ